LGGSYKATLNMATQATLDLEQANVRVERSLQTMSKGFDKSNISVSKFSKTLGLSQRTTTKTI